jgi:hypothetical protein
MEQQGNNMATKSDDSTSSKTEPDISMMEVTQTNPLREDDDNVRKNQESLHRKPRWVRFRHTFREPLAEFFGVFTLIIFGDGVVAQVVLSKGQKGDYQSISWGYSLALLHTNGAVGELELCWVYMCQE